MNRFTGKTLLFMAGGTGGHVYPALAVAKAAEKEGASIHWLGNAVGFEGDKVPANGYPLHDIKVRGLRGNGLLGWLKAPFMILRAVLRARQVIRQIKPDVVIGMGGFASGPGGLAAKWQGVPLVIHEQNAVMGMTNTYLAKIATTVLLADAHAASKLPKGKAYLSVGNPVRADIAAIAPPEVRYKTHTGKIHLLVLGGSQGAKAINHLVPEALALLPEAERPNVVHQVGPRWLEVTQAKYQSCGVDAKVVAFIDDMAAAYAKADWIIARSGASTVAEIATAGLPALFIPFPYAVDDHQTANARTLEEAGSAQIIQEKTLDSARLSAEMMNYTNREQLEQLAVKARSCSHAQALEQILNAVKDVMK